MRIFKLEKVTCSDSACPYCSAGPYNWEMFQMTDEGWSWVATSLQSYRTEEEAQLHNWGFVTEPNDRWTDGSPFEWDADRSAT